jgi:predicted ABC-type ATPase
MVYISAGSLDTCLTRVIARGLGGGHSAPVEQLKRIYEAGVRNLPRAIGEIDGIRVYDNSCPGKPPELLLDVRFGKQKYMLTPLPEWLASALKEVKFS